MIWHAFNLLCCGQYCRFIHETNLDLIFIKIYLIVLRYFVYCLQHSNYLSIITFIKKILIFRTDEFDTIQFTLPFLLQNIFLFELKSMIYFFYRLSSQIHKNVSVDKFASKSKLDDLTLTVISYHRRMM